uniref:Uncharacterized protein n=1 Tax=Anopheles atroparvus TaxID=41427 RepID=A0A182ILI2_ANOAO
MLFRKLQNDRAVLPLILFLQEQIGLWNESKRVRFPLIFAGYCLFVALPKLTSSYPDIPTCICGIAELIFISNVQCGGMLLWLQHDTFKPFVQELQSVADHLFLDHSMRSGKQYLIDFNHQVHRYTNIYYFNAAFFIVFYMVTPVISSIWVYFRYMVKSNFLVNGTANGTSEVLMEEHQPAEFNLHMEQDFYGLEPRTNVVHYTIYTCFVLPVMIATAFTAHMKLLTTFTCASYCGAFLHLLAMKLNHLRHMPRESMPDELRDIVQTHQRTLNCIHLLVITLQPMLLMQLVFCVYIWCSMMLYFVVVDELSLKFVNLAILFVVITIEMSGTCYFGTRLSTQVRLDRIGGFVNPEKSSLRSFPSHNRVPN